VLARLHDLDAARAAYAACRAKYPAKLIMLCQRRAHPASERSGMTHPARAAHTACLIKYPAKLLFLKRRAPAHDQNDDDQEHNDIQGLPEPEPQAERLCWGACEKFEDDHF
jgi:hypothetical protein